ncbi:MAG TPA: glycosyltransferase [Candidatus Eisenbacteria bacterium]|nr:glycosyltransferase [Candidatus Eisenbacteria bacterium]
MSALADRSAGAAERSGRALRFVWFVHSLRSDWNHGNAHFLRGVIFELGRRGHEADVYEPEGAWSLAQLLEEHGPAAVKAFESAYPGLHSRTYRLEGIDLDRVLDGADVVIVHEWNDPALLRRLGDARRRMPSLRLFFHDTHHRAVTKPEEIGQLDLSEFDGVLAFGRILSDHYRDRGWTRAAWTWHEAADPRVFRPHPGVERSEDLVWIGNWGDGERARELSEYLLGPARALGLRATVYGVRYPDEARRALDEAGIRYRGWLPNFEAPAVFARHKATVHVPRWPYARALPGIPTIRVFEALACGIPLVCAPWEDAEGLFTPHRDYEVARSGARMRERLRELIHEPERGAALAEHGLATIRSRHTCAHRVDELLSIVRETSGTPGRATAAADAEARA